MIVVLGVLVTLYTMLGGIQAVIWNDVIQFCIMFGGLAATVWIALTHVPGGLAEIWTRGADGRQDVARRADRAVRRRPVLGARPGVLQAADQRHRDPVRASCSGGWPATRAIR